MPNQNTVTIKGDLIQMDVMGKVIGEKLEKDLKMIPIAKHDNTLSGQPGDTIKHTIWSNPGRAEVVGENQKIPRTKVKQRPASYTVKKLVKTIGISEEALHSSMGKPADVIERMLRRSLREATNDELFQAACATSHILNDSGPTGILDYDQFVDMATTFEDESYGTKRIFFLNPRQEGQLLRNTDFKTMLFAKGVVKEDGSIGSLFGVKFEKSRMIPCINAEIVTSGTSGAVKVTAQNYDQYWIYDSTKEEYKVFHPAFDDAENGITGQYVKPIAVPYYMNMIIKCEEDNPETDYTESEFPALTIHNKLDVQTHYEWDMNYGGHVFQAHMIAGHNLTNEDKVVCSKIRALPAAAGS